MYRSWTVGIGLLLTALLVACGRAHSATFNYSIDPTVQPDPAAIPDGPQGPRPLAAVV